MPNAAVGVPPQMPTLGCMSRSSYAVGYMCACKHAWGVAQLHLQVQLAVDDTWFGPSNTFTSCLLSAGGASELRPKCVKHQAQHAFPCKMCLVDHSPLVALTPGSMFPSTCACCVCCKSALRASAYKTSSSKELEAEVEDAGVLSGEVCTSAEGC